MTETTILYRVERIDRKTADGEELLQIQDFKIARGEFIILGGANGSGKTLLLRYLLGLESTGGSAVYLRERKLTRRISQAGDAISYVPQHPEDTVLGLTVIEDLCFSLAGREESVVRELLTEFDLGAIKERASIVLSGGEMRRLAIAAALATRPDLLFLDEAFGELDYPNVRQLLKVLCRLNSQGVTIVFVTHDFEKVLAHCTRLIILQSGKIVFDAPPARLAPAHERFGIRIPLLPVSACSWLA